MTSSTSVCFSSQTQLMAGVKKSYEFQLLITGVRLFPAVCKLIICIIQQHMYKSKQLE